jgi:hypothetical protein
MELTISSLMRASERGDDSAAETLFAALYAELHRLAKRELARRGIPVTLSATTLCMKPTSLLQSGLGHLFRTVRDSWDTPPA